MILSQLVGLVSVSIAGRSKELKTFRRSLNGGDHGKVSQPNWTLYIFTVSNDRSLKISGMIELGLLLTIHYRRGFANSVVMSKVGAKFAKNRKYA